MSLHPKFRCGHCLELHDDEYEAADCCRPSVSEVYLCPICNTEYDDEDDAIDCCDPEAAMEYAADDGRKFPQGIHEVSAYVSAFCEANNLRA